MCCGLNSTYILMLHVFEQPELPVSPLSKYLRLERPVELLNGHFLFGPLIYCWAVVNNGTPSHYLCTHDAFAFHYNFLLLKPRENDMMVCFEVSLSAQIGGELLHPRSEWRGLWLFECRHVSVWQLVMWTLATICRAPIRGRKSLLGYLQPLPPTHIAHTCAECCRWHRCMKVIKQLIKKITTACK